jgi:dGTPase
VNLDFLIVRLLILRVGLYSNLDQFAGLRSEAELMDWADDVAYSVHDLEDFHRCNAIPWHKIFRDPSAIIEHAANGMPQNVKERLERAYGNLDKHLKGNFDTLLTEPYEGSREQREQLRRMTSQMIGKYIAAVTVLPGGSERSVSIEQDILDEVSLLKQITRDYIIGSPSLSAQQHGQRKIVKGLFNEIYKALNGSRECPEFLPIRLRYMQAIAKSNKARFVADCVASLSEREATGLHSRLFGAVAGSVLDPIVR